MCVCVSGGGGLINIFLAKSLSYNLLLVKRKHCLAVWRLPDLCKTSAHRTNQNTLRYLLKK